MAADVREDQKSRDVEALKVEMEKLRCRRRGNDRTLRDLGGSIGEQAAGRVRETAGRARAKVNKTADDVGHQIEERPLVSIIGAFLLGLLLGALFSRR